METFGQKIRRLRKERGLTQQALAGETVSGSMISQIEADRAAPSEQVMLAIAEKLNVDPSVLNDDVLVKTDQTAMYRKAKQLMDERQFQEALPLLLGLIQPVAQFREQVIQHDLIECYENLRLFDEAANMMLKLISGAYARNDVQTVIHTYFRLARFERNRNRHFMARKYLIQAVELLKRHTELDMPLAGRIYTLLGRVCLALHLHTEALAAYEDAIELTAHKPSDVNQASVYHGMASLYMEIGQGDLALKALDLAVVHYIDRDDEKMADLCLINKTVVKRKAGRYDEALEEIEQLRRIPRFQEDSTLLAECQVEEALNHFGQGRLTDAFAVGVRCLAMPLELDHLHELYSMLMEIVLEERNWSEADRLYALALETFPAEYRHQLFDLDCLHIRCLAAHSEVDRAAEAAKHLVGRFLESTP